MAQSNPRDTLAPWATVVPGVGAMTAEELLALPEDPFWRYELVEGRLVRMAPTSGDHGETAGNLHGALYDWVLSRHLGRVYSAETGFQISGATVLAPDVAYVRSDRIPARGSAARQGFWKLAPDIVVEVVSPVQLRNGLETKAREWLTGGALLVWLVWPESEQVDVWRMVGMDATRQ